MSIFKRFASKDDIFESGSEKPVTTDISADPFAADPSIGNDSDALVLSQSDITDAEEPNERTPLEPDFEDVEKTATEMEDSETPRVLAQAEETPPEAEVLADKETTDDWIEEWVAPFEDAPNEDKLQVLPETKDNDQPSTESVVPDKLATDLILESPAHTFESSDSEKPLDYNAEDYAADYITSHSDGLNLGELRLDIVRITSDIESGETLYRRAQQRIDSLMGFLEKAEVGLSALKRLEPEARHLKIENRRLKTDLEAQRYTSARLESELKDQKDAAANAAVKIETLRHTLEELKVKLEEKHQDIHKLTAAKDDQTVKAERIKTDLDIQARENASMREKMGELVAHIDRLNGQRLELLEATENFKIEQNDIEDKQNSLETQNAQLLLALRKSERQSDEVRGEMVEVQNKIVSFKSHHEQQILQRDEKISMLESKLAEVDRKLKHKDDVLNTQTFEITDLKKCKARHDIDKEKLEGLVANQTALLTKADEDLRKARRNVAALTTRCKDLTQTAAMANLNDTQPTRKHPDIVNTPEVHVARDALATSQNYRSPFLDTKSP